MAIESVELPGTGSKVAVDTIDTDKAAQIVKLAIGTDGAADLVPGDATYGIAADVTRLPVDADGANAAVKVTGYDSDAEAYADLEIWDGKLPVIVTGPASVTSGDAQVHQPPDGYGLTMVGGFLYGAGASLPVDVGDAVAISMDPNGLVRVLPGANSGVDIGDVDVTSISAGDNNIGNVDIVTVPAPLNVVGNGAGATAMRVTMANDSTGIVALTTSTASIGKLAANSGVDVGDVDVTSVAGMPTGASASQVQGTVAAGSAAAQNPVQMGAKAVSTLPAAVDANDVAPVQTDLYGRTLVLPYAPAADTISGCSAALTDTTATNVVATDSGNGLKWYVTDILVTNSHATVGTLVDVRDSADLVIWQGYAAPAGGGWSHHFVTPVCTGANTHIHAKNTTTGSNTYVCVSAFKAV